MTASGLELRDVSISLNGQSLFAPVSGLAGPGQVLSVMGPSGSGKSTLLSCIAGLADPVFTVGGQILLDGESLAGRTVQDRHVGLMFQEALLFPHMNVAENLAFGLPRHIARDKKQKQAAVDQALAEAGMTGFGRHHPDTLSGGQRARIALMRVLLSEPSLLLLDEPFSRLDRDLRQSVRQFVFDHADKRQLPVFMVTHDMEDAEAAGGEILQLHVL